MAAKKKTKKKHTKSKRIAGNKVRPMKKTAKKTLAMKRAAPSKKLGKKKASEAVGNKTIGSKMGPFSQKRAGARSGQQSGDLQGLSRVGRADSESVGELIEEGNAFEADVVTGVENADDADEKEVRTHEVPEDDVPSEYLDKDL